jgi:hypothetical protein
MDQNTALHKLLESADLAKMLEELVAPGNLERLSPASLSGIRVTLRSLREAMLVCHDLLAGELVARPQARYDNNVLQQRGVTTEPTGVPLAARGDSPSIVRQALANEQPKTIKKDLRSSLDQIVERSVI